MKAFMCILSYRGKELVSIPVQAISRKDAKKTGYWHRRQYEQNHKLKPIQSKIL